MVTTNSVLDALQLEAAGDRRYRAGNVDFGGGTVTGGQLIGQSLVAAASDAAAHGNDDKVTKTIHTVFARAASADLPVDLLVQQIQSGRTFASVNVTISQNDRICAQSLVVLTAIESDFIRHADRAGSVTPPSDEPANGEWQVRIVDGVDLADPDLVGPPDLDVWVRFDAAPSDAVLNQALLAFSTDFFLIGTAMRPHAGVGQAQSHKTLSTGVITHTLTFHEPALAASWTLMSHHSTFAGHGRSFGRADVFRSDGVLAASFVQDGMIRPMGDSIGGRL
jgi:acyl-CoA thioesterase II